MISCFQLKAQSPKLLRFITLKKKTGWWKCIRSFWGVHSCTTTTPKSSNSCNFGWAGTFWKTFLCCLDYWYYGNWWILYWRIKWFWQPDLWHWNQLSDQGAECWGIWLKNKWVSWEWKNINYILYLFFFSCFFPFLIFYSPFQVCISN